MQSLNSTHNAMRPLTVQLALLLTFLVAALLSAPSLAAGGRDLERALTGIDLEQPELGARRSDPRRAEQHACSQSQCSGFRKGLTHGVFVWMQFHFARGEAFRRLFEEQRLQSVDRSAP